MDADDVKQSFAQEVGALVGSVKGALRTLAEAPAETDRLWDRSRDLHVIGGVAAVLAVDPTTRLAREMAGAVDAMRSGRPAMDPQDVALLLACCEHTDTLVEAVLRGAPAEERIAALLARSDGLVTRLAGATAGGTAATRQGGQGDAGAGPL